jgi:diguanylate cyclase (GGDEF)-like protein
MGSVSQAGGHAMTPLHVPLRTRRNGRTLPAVPTESLAKGIADQSRQLTVAVTAEKTFLKFLSELHSAHDIYALVIVDIDHFRALRNLHGLGAAECLLQTLGGQLNNEAANLGGRMMRLGLDEFAVVVPAARCQPTLLNWAEKLTSGFATSYRGASFDVTVSAGLALCSSNHKTPVEALCCARQAVIQAKRSGCGTVTRCSLQQLREASARSTLALDFRGAIARGEVVPFYQPIVSLCTHRVTGMEVLARWMHPKLGLLEPADFIPIAEDYGLCSALTGALLRQARVDAQPWPAHLVFAFNTSPNELPAVLDFIAVSERATGHKIQGSRIELEVTETALMQDLDLARRAVAALQPFGVKVALDDFGSGYANFNQLCQVPFSRLKIDKSLVTNMLADTRVQACTQAIIDLAHMLGMTATAEGVEDAAVAKRLADMGCDSAQGYYFGRPMAAPELSMKIAGVDGAADDFGWAA